MTENNEVRVRIGRILDLVGELLREVGALEQLSGGADDAVIRRAGMSLHGILSACGSAGESAAEKERAAASRPPAPAGHALVGACHSAPPELEAATAKKAVEPVSAPQARVPEAMESNPEPREHEAMGVSPEPPAQHAAQNSQPDLASGAQHRSGAVYVVSPSTLARRFLTSHLAEMGMEAVEARDLEDPLLPADLSSLGGLFLDENLLESWQARQAKEAMPPTVILTVDLPAYVPPPGDCSGKAAFLPRPFERSEVERVVAWLHSLPEDTTRRECDRSGSEEDDTWLFADPFRTASAGEHPGR